MKKLSALLAVLFVGSALSLAACKKDEKKDDTKTEKKAEEKKEEPKKEEPKKEEPKKEEAAAGSTGLADCDAYVAAMDKYMQCDKVPQSARDAAKQGLDAMKQGAQAMGCEI